MSERTHKLDQIDPERLKSGTFKDQFQYILALQSQNVLKLILKSPRFESNNVIKIFSKTKTQDLSYLGAKQTQFGGNPTIGAAYLSMY